jgi:hypothetical protein
MAYRSAEMLVADELAAVKAPMAYRSAETLTDDAAAMGIAANVTRCVTTEADEDVETLNEASLMTLPDALSVDALAQVNAAKA